MGGKKFTSLSTTSHPPTLICRTKAGTIEKTAVQREEGEAVKPLQHALYTLRIIKALLILNVLLWPEYGNVTVKAVSLGSAAGCKRLDEKKNVINDQEQVLICYSIQQTENERVEAFIETFISQDSHQVH